MVYPKEDRTKRRKRALRPCPSKTIEAGMTYVMQVQEHHARGAGYTGADRATIVVGGETLSATTTTGAIMQLARKVVASGHPDGPWEARGSDGALRLHGPSIQRLARWTVSETERSGPRLRRFRSFAAQGA